MSECVVERNLWRVMMRGWTVGYIGLATFSSGRKLERSMLSKTLALDRKWHNGRARMTMSQPEACRVASEWSAESSVAVRKWIVYKVGIKHDYFA